MGFGGCRSGLNGPLLFCLNFAAIDRIHDAFAPDEHADGSTVTEQRSDVITNLSVLGVQVLSRRDRRSSAAKGTVRPEVTRKPAQYNLCVFRVKRHLYGRISVVYQRFLPMPTPTPALPVEYIDKYLGLCPSSESGLKWIARPPRSKISIGSVAGSRTYEGYWRVKCDGRECRAHRIVFYLATGTDPKGVEVDHIDRDRSNNDPLNLRLANPSLQQRNRGKQKNSTSQYKGVCFKKGRWVAMCCVWLPDGTLSKTRYHGRYDTEEEAYAEVLRHRPEFAEFSAT